MSTHQVVSPDQWLASRKALMDKEKAFTRLRDELSRRATRIAMGQDREELRV